MVDHINNLLNIIKNGQAVFRTTVEIPFSNFNFEIVKILERSGFVGKYEKKGKKSKKTIEITLKYDEPGRETETGNKEQFAGGNVAKIPEISGIKRISKPGKRIYIEAANIRKIRGGYGIIIISTSKGLMTNKEAKKQNIGGEVICEIW